MPRTKKQKQISPSNRDYEMLASLYCLRLASTKQLSKLFFNEFCKGRYPLRYTQRRLRELSESGFLRIANSFDVGLKREYLYDLTNKGIELIIYEFFNNPFDENNKRRYKTAAENTVRESLRPHHLLTNDIFVELYSAGFWEGKSPLDVLKNDWFETRRTSIEFENTSFKNYQLKPDASFNYNGVTYYVEVDRGTELVVRVQEKIDRYIQLKMAGKLVGERQSILLFCADRDDKTSTQTMNRIAALRQGFLKSAERYLGEDFKISIGYMDSLLDGMIQKKQSGDAPGRRLAERIEAELSLKGYRVVIRDDFLPIENYHYRSALWLAFTDSAGDSARYRLCIRGIESFIDYDLSTWKRIGEFPQFYDRALQEETPFRPVLWVIVASESDIRYLIKQFPNLANCTEFIMNNTFYKTDGEAIWEVDYDVEV